MRVLAGLALVLLVSPGASAAPGDPRVIVGVVEWPASLGAEPFAVLRGDDGRLYYADVGTAHRHGAAEVHAGDRVAVAGVEGLRPHELLATLIAADDAPPRTMLPTLPPDTASAPSASPLTSQAPARPADLWRLHGAVTSLAGGSVTLRAEDGRRYRVDVSPLTRATRAALRVGDVITLYGEPTQDLRLVATGFLQIEPPAPAASPRSRP